MLKVSFLLFVLLTFFLRICYDMDRDSHGKFKSLDLNKNLWSGRVFDTDSGDIKIIRLC